MAAEGKKEIELEIAHVLFIDIVGYSKLLTDEQSEALQELNQIVRNTEAVREAETAGTLTMLPTGDGMALVFTGSVEEPAECALEISRALKEHPQLRLRMGAHRAARLAIGAWSIDLLLKIYSSEYSARTAASRLRKPPFYPLNYGDR